jgi:hypothetical protein
MKTVTGEIIPASDMLLHEFLRESQWRKQARNELTVYLRGTSRPVEPTSGPGRKLDDFHTLLSAQRLTPNPGDATLLRLTWELQAQRPLLLWVALILRDSGGRSFFISKGPIAPEITVGRMSEEWAIRPPPSLKPGKYRTGIHVYDPFDPDRPADKQRFKSVTFDTGEVDLK